jgi:hypothetical protein
MTLEPSSRTIAPQLVLTSWQPQLNFRTYRSQYSSSSGCSGVFLHAF